MTKGFLEYTLLEAAKKVETLLTHIKNYDHDSVIRHVARNKAHFDSKTHAHVENIKKHVAAGKHDKAEVHMDRLDAHLHKVHKVERHIDENKQLADIHAKLARAAREDGKISTAKHHADRAKAERAKAEKKKPTAEACHTVPGQKKKKLAQSPEGFPADVSGAMTEETSLDKHKFHKQMRDAHQEMAALAKKHGLHDAYKAHSNRAAHHNDQADRHLDKHHTQKK